MKYFYYRIYKALTKIKTNNTPALNAMVLFVALQGLNVFSIFDVINHFLRIEIDKQQAMVGGLLLYVILLIPNYVYLFRKRNEIVKQFQNETKEDKTWGLIGLLLYILVSIIAFIVL